MNNGSNTIKSKTMTRVREEEEDAKPRALGPSKKSQIIVTSGRQQRPPRAKRSCSSPAAEGGGLDRHTFHSSSSSLSTATTTTTKKHHHRRSASSSVSWKCEGATTEDSGLDQFIAANNRGVVFDFVNSFSSSGSKASLPNGEDEDEDGAVDKNTSLHARPPPPPPSSGLASSNLKPPPPSSTPRVVRDLNGSEKDEVAKPRAAPSRGAAKPPPPSSSFASSSTNLKRPPPPASRVGVVRDNNKDEFLFIEENNRNALIDFVRSVSSSTSVTTASTSATSKTSSLAIDEYDDEYDDDDVENQKKKTTKDVDCVCISKREAARQLERARVGASVGERQREVAVKTLMFFALAISLFVLNQKIRSTAPDGSDTPYFTTVVEQMLSGIERIRTERQTGPD